MVVIKATVKRDPLSLGPDEEDPGLVQVSYTLNEVDPPKKGSVLSEMSQKVDKEEKTYTVDLVANHQLFIDFIRNHDKYSAGTMLSPKCHMIVDGTEIRTPGKVMETLENIMMTGFSGCGKTLAVKSLVKALGRPDFYFNLGATQDPRATLIGNTHYDSSKGTYFSESTFVKAISTPNAVILLDELSRAHPDAWNILMTVLDQGQRYLRLDEHENSPTINVAEGVCFVATANIGNQFTSTRVMDRALLDRFTIIEMDLLTDLEETNLLEMMFPSVEKDMLKAIAEISHSTRIEMSAESPRLSNMISTRMSVEIAGLLSDGFGLDEASEIAVYPFFDADGGLDSERTYIKQLVQKYLGSSDEELFTEQDMNESEN